MSRPNPLKITIRRDTKEIVKGTPRKKGLEEEEDGNDGLCDILKKKFGKKVGGEERGVQGQVQREMVSN